MGKESEGMAVNDEPVGAWAIINWADGENIPEFQPYFISFGQWIDIDENGMDVEPTHDSLGNRDDLVFYYCPMGEVEVQLLMKECGNDFTVVSYELEYVPNA